MRSDLQLELNLASRPFQNRRLPRALLALAWALVLAATAVHAVVAHGLLTRQASAGVDELARLESKLGRMQARQQAGTEQVEETRLERWATLKSLVDGRAFSWTRLLAILEQALPDGVRIEKLSPRETDGQLQILFRAQARSAEDGRKLIEAFEARPEFSRVYPLRLEDEDGLRTLECVRFYEPPAPEETHDPAADGGDADAEGDQG